MTAAVALAAGGSARLCMQPSVHSYALHACWSTQQSMQSVAAVLLACHEQPLDHLVRPQAHKVGALGAENDSERKQLKWIGIH